MGMHMDLDLPMPLPVLLPMLLGMLLGMLNRGSQARCGEGIEMELLGMGMSIYIDLYLEHEHHELDH